MLEKNQGNCSVSNQESVMEDKRTDTAFYLFAIIKSTSGRSPFDIHQNESKWGRVRN